VWTRRLKPFGILILVRPAVSPKVRPTGHSAAGNPSDPEPVVTIITAAAVAQIGPSTASILARPGFSHKTRLSGRSEAG